MTLNAPIDPAQLSRIENTHKGFLFQHLYSVGCLLLAQNADVCQIVIEHDEDLELELVDSWIYVQVKKRQEQLNWSDIQTSVENFSEIEARHTEGERPGNPYLFIVSNVSPGQRLVERIANPDWNSKIDILWPGKLGTLPNWSPPIGETIDQTMAWCQSTADKIPFCSVSANVLVWKLAAIVQSMAAGEGFGHSIQASNLPEIFGQVVVQIQTFPEAADPYLPHLSEPEYRRNSSARMIVGHSGCGKTAWCVQASSHSPDVILYFDVGEHT